MPMFWTPAQALLLAGVAIAVAFLLGSEILEARRSRRRLPVPVSTAEKSRRAAAPLASPSAPVAAPAPHDAWRTSPVAVPAAALRQASLD